MGDRPLCFVLMPFRTKRDPVRGKDIDFDRVYEAGIRPAIAAAGMEPLRADAEATGGFIHKAMYERLLLCDFAVADLTTANANVFYELGIRHATRPHTTVTIFASHQPMPFDVGALRSLPYDLDDDDVLDDGRAEALQLALGKRLVDLRREAHARAPTDSPLFQLLDGYEAPDLARLRTDAFRDRVDAAEGVKARLAVARSARDPAALKAIEAGLGDLDGAEAGVLVDLYLSYRALGTAEGWQAMVDLYDRLPIALRRVVLVREQLGFALNRLKRRDEAQRVLEAVVAEVGPSSETCGLIGRVCKDRWVEARAAGEAMRATGLLRLSIDWYERGFKADWRDAYPGINAVTLLDVLGGKDAEARKAELLPLVRFAAQQRLARTPDYWDHATMLELAVLARDPDDATGRLERALAAVREPWEPATTANNLRLIQDARRARGAADAWVDEVIAALGTTK